MALIIEQDDYEYVLSALSFPFIDPAELNLPYTENTVKKFCILPSMKEYFMYFPIREEKSVAVASGSSGEIDFPDDYTYGVAHTSLTETVDSMSSGSIYSGNPFVTQQNVVSTSQSAFGSQYDYGYNSIMGAIKASNNTRRASNKVFRTVTNHQKRVLEYYTSNSGYLEIVWAKWSEDFNSIRWSHHLDVLHLSQAKLLTWLGNTLSMQDSEFPTQLDSDAMIDRGEDIETKVKDKWKNYTKGVVLR